MRATSHSKFDLSVSMVQQFWGNVENTNMENIKSQKLREKANN